MVHFHHHLGSDDSFGLQTCIYGYWGLLMTEVKEEPTVCTLQVVPGVAQPGP